MPLTTSSLLPCLQQAKVVAKHAQCLQDKAQKQGSQEDLVPSGLLHQDLCLLGATYSPSALLGGPGLATLPVAGLQLVGGTAGQLS